MGEAFSLDGPLAMVEKRRKVLVTGAGGRIGSYFAEHAQDRYDFRLMIRSEDKAADLERFGEIVVTDLSDLDGLKEAFQGVDTVVHMAADPSPEGKWDSILPNNIVGTYHAMIAAKTAQCRRFIYASSIHAVSGYPPDVQVKPSDPVNPGDLYGVSKCFGEALGRYMAEQEGLSVICLRIGGFQPPSTVESPDGLHLMDAWVSHRDLHQLLCQCVDVENLRFAIFHGLSDNRFKRLDITSARELVGYTPQDDFTERHPSFKNLDLDDAVDAHSLSDGMKSGIRADLR